MSSVASGPRGRYDGFWSRSSLLVAANIMAEGNKKHQPTEHQNALIEHYESRVTPTEENEYHFIHNNNQDATTDDPLIQWLAYIQYVQNEFPDDTSTKLLLMERCTWALAHSRQYANDDRFLRICMRYAVNTTDPLHDIFEYLDMCHVGRKVSWFWVQRACLAEDAGDYALAKRLLEQGKTYDAQPADELAKHYTALLERMIDVFLAEQKNRHDDYGTGDADNTLGNLRNGSNAKRRSAATEVRHKAARFPSPEHQVLDHVQSNRVERRGDFSEQLFPERARGEFALIDWQRHANTQHTDSKPASRHGGKVYAMEQVPPNVGKVSSSATMSPVARRAPTQDSTPRRTFQSQSNIGDHTENCPSTKNSPSSIKESDEKKRPAKRARMLQPFAVNVGMECSAECGQPKPGPAPDVPVAQVKQEQQDCPVVIEIADSDDEDTGTCERRRRNVSNGHTGEQPVAVESLNCDGKLAPVQPTEMDVLFGQSKELARRQGNVAFREIVRSFHKEYRSVVPKYHKVPIKTRKRQSGRPRGQKRGRTGTLVKGRPICINVLQRVKSEGRRLLKRNCHNIWSELDQETAVAKIQAAFRLVDKRRIF